MYRGLRMLCVCIHVCVCVCGGGGVLPGEQPLLYGTSFVIVHVSGHLCLCVVFGAQIDYVLTLSQFSPNVHFFPISLCSCCTLVEITLRVMTTSVKSWRMHSWRTRMWRRRRKLRCWSFGESTLSKNLRLCTCYENTGHWRNAITLTSLSLHSVPCATQRGPAYGECIGTLVVESIELFK